MEGYTGACAFTGLNPSSSSLVVYISLVIMSMFKNTQGKKSAFSDTIMYLSKLNQHKKGDQNLGLDIYGEKKRG